MNARLKGTIFALALLAVGAAPAFAQDVPLDPRWMAWLGCWEPVGEGPASLRGETPRICVVPVADAPAVELVTLATDSVLARQRLEASGERHGVARQGCAGWEAASFSSTGARVFLQAEQACEGVVRPRTATAVMAITADGEWLDVQGVGVDEHVGLRVTRYRPVGPGAVLPADIAAALAGREMAVAAARAAAAARLTPADVIEASDRLPAEVVEAWLTETGNAFALDARTLRDLAGAGVPGRVTDVMIALSYPGTFAVGRRMAEPSDSAGERVDYRTAYSYPSGLAYGWGYYDAYGYYQGQFSPYDRYGYAYGSRYGYGYGPGGLFGPDYYGRPVIIVVSGAGSVAGAMPQGRVINGRGYSSGSNSPTARVAGPSRGAGGGGGGASGSVSRGDGGQSGSTASSGGYGAGGAGGSDTGRTAKPRP